MRIDEKAAAASQTGRPLVPELVPEGVQVAGKGNVIFDIFKALRGTPNTIEGGRIPTSVEERLLKPGEYEARQQEQAPGMLSTEGQERFEASGFNAADAINPPASVQALDALDVPMAETVTDAQQSLRTVDPETMTAQPGVAGAQGADELDALGAANAVEPERLDAFVRAGSDGLDFNFSNLETGDDVKAMINEVSEIYADPITAAKRGVVTQKETLAEAEQMLADEMGFTKKLLKRKRGIPFNASEATASRIILTRSAERLSEMAQAIANGERSPAALIAFRRQMSIHAGIQMQVKGMQTEIARAMNAFNIPVSARTPEMKADISDAMLLETGGTYEAVKLAKGLLDVQRRNNHPSAVHKYAFKGFLSKANGVFGEVYVNGLLSWTYTHIKNFVATPMFMAYQGAEELLAGLYGGVERGIGRAIGLKPEGIGKAGFGNTADGVYVGQVAARWYGQSRSFKDAWITAAETFRTEIPADALTKIEGSQLRAIDAENLEMSGRGGQFIDHLGKAIRIPGRALMGADDFWRVFAQRGELSSEAYHAAMMAKSLGKTDQEALDNFAIVTLDPRSYANQVDATARYNSLTTDTGKFGEVTGVLQNLPVIGRLLLPFSKVPINSVLRVMERMYPSGFFKDPVKRQKAVARVTLAYGALYTLTEYAADGKLTGSMPKDQRQRDMLPPNWKPYSFVTRGDNWPTDADGDDLPIFDPRTGAPNGALTYVSYAGLEPIGAILGIAASYAESQRRTSDPEAGLKKASLALAAASDYFFDMPMIQVIGDFVKAYEKGDASGVMRSPIAGAMPYSAAVRAGERAANPTLRTPSSQPEYYTLAEIEDPSITPFVVGPGGEQEPNYKLAGKIKGGMGATFNDAMAKWESMLTDREIFGGAEDDTSAIRYDVFGDARENNVRFDVNPVMAIYNMIIPFNVRRGEALNDAQYEQIRLKGPLRDTKRKEKGFGFSEAFRSEWTRAAKQEVMVESIAGRAEKFKPALNSLIGSAEYGSMTDQQRFNAIRNLEDEFYDAGLVMVFQMKRYEKVRDAYFDYRLVTDDLKAKGRLRR